VSTLFRLHKRAPASHKLSALYLIDAVVRECKVRAKRAGGGAGKQNGKEQEESGTFVGLLQKMERCLERLVDEAVQRGKPEHKVSKSERPFYLFASTLEG
jgi:protein NRD1